MTSAELDRVADLISRVIRPKDLTIFEILSASARLVDVHLGDDPAPFVGFYRSARSNLTTGGGMPMTDR